MLTQRFVASINWSESLEGDIYRQQGHLIDLLPFGNNGKYAEIISYVFSQFKKKTVKGYLFSTEMFSYYHVSRGETHTKNEGYSNVRIWLLHQILRSKEQ